MSNMSSYGMHDEEFCRWFAFMNMLKFSSHYARLKNLPRDFDMPWKAQLNYIDDVSGDLLQQIREKKGVPHKYSLNSAHDDAIVFHDLEYT